MYKPVWHEYELTQSKRKFQVYSVSNDTDTEGKRALTGNLNGQNNGY